MNDFLAEIKGLLCCDYSLSGNANDMVRCLAGGSCVIFFKYKVFYLFNFLFLSILSLQFLNKYKVL